MRHLVSLGDHIAGEYESIIIQLVRIPAYLPGLPRSFIHSYPDS